MYSLTSTLGTASQALNAESGAIAVTSNNIANVNTVGYARQVADLDAAALSGNGTLQGNGVSFGGYASVRDEILQLSINQKTSDSASLNAQSTSWSQIEAAFSDSSNGLGSAISSFFSAFANLSTTPSDAAVRQNALSSAGQLVNQFHQASAALSDAASSANQAVKGVVAKINQLSTQIASLDQQLAPILAEGQDGGSLQGQRDALTTQLAQLVGVSTIQTSAAPTLALQSGTPLVSNGIASLLQVSQAMDGTAHVLDAQGQDITADITGGTLGGTLAMRDESIPVLSASLDQFAAEFAASVNTVQTSGYDVTGAHGQALFTLPLTGSSAAGISLALSSGSGIAASADGRGGDTGNLKNLLAIQNTSLTSGNTPSDTFAAFVQQIGLSSGQVTSSLQATSTALSQLNSLQSSQSGVSVDEETTNLVRYQQAYSAAAQVITTINSLFNVVLNMGAN